MGDRTSIEWTDATWSPVTGCTKVSPGCDHCYAETFAERFRGTPGHYFEHGFDVQLRPAMLDRPLRWARPRRIFVCSMADLFHDAVPDEYIADVFAVMAIARQHTFQVLTKRHGRMRSLLNSRDFLPLVARLANQRAGRTAPPYALPGWPLPNVWLGVSTENQQWADIRIPALLETPAAVRWISAEPLLGPIDLRRVAPEPISVDEWSGTRHTNALGYLWGSGRPAIDWVVVGGESGRGARPMHPDWARSLRDQCDAADVAFLFKQWGEWAASYQLRSPRAIPSGPTVRGEHLIQTDHGVIRMHKVGKKAAGRELDGRTHDGYPA